MTREEIQNEKNLLNTERLNLEASLHDGDYKIIKCAEAQSIGAEMPYDANALHAERQLKRDRINVIDERLAELDAMEPEEEEIPDRGFSMSE